MGCYQREYKSKDIRNTRYAVYNIHISDLLELRVKFLAEVLAEEEISIKRALYDRLKVYIEEFLNKRFDVFLAENRTEIVGAVFVLYYEKVPDMQINNGKVGVPVNFFIQPSYKKTDLAKCLLRFAVECTLEKVTVKAGSG